MQGEEQRPCPAGPQQPTRRRPLPLLWLPRRRPPPSLLQEEQQPAQQAEDHQRRQHVYRQVSAVVHVRIEADARARRGRHLGDHRQQAPDRERQRDVQVEGAQTTTRAAPGGWAG